MDETGSHLGLTPLYSRAPRGERARGRAPRNQGKNRTVLTSLTLEGMGPGLLLEGAVTTRAFEVYVEAVLAPTLRPGQIVVVDNLKPHRSDRARRAIEARGASVRFLPTYSPDLTPIEEAFSKVKGLLRRAAARTDEALATALWGALSAVTPHDAAGWYRHGGYLPPPARARRRRSTIPVRRGLTSRARRRASTVRTPRQSARRSTMHTRPKAQLFCKPL